MGAENRDNIIASCQSHLMFGAVPVRDLLMSTGLVLRDAKVFAEVAIHDGYPLFFQFNWRQMDRRTLPLSMTKSVLTHAVMEIAQKHDVPENWFDDTLHFVATNPIAVEIWGDFPDNGQNTDGGLRVFMASPEYALGMMLWGGSQSILPEADGKSIRSLMAICGLRSREDTIAFLTHFFPGQSLPTPHMCIVDHILEMDPIEQM